MSKLALALSVVALALAGCGGGGGSSGGATDTGSTLHGGDPARLFEGVYFFQSISASRSSDLGFSYWGTVAADGVGSLDWQAFGNANGTVGGPDTGAYPYTVDEDGRLRWFGGTAVSAMGGVSASGDLGVLAAAADGLPYLSIQGLRQGIHDAGDLSGDYHIVGFSYEAGSAWPTVAFFGTASFDGAGGGSVEMDGNAHGVGTAFDAAVLYDVAPDGLLRLDMNAGYDLVGGVVRGGDVAMVSGAATAGRAPGLFMLIRQSAAPATASLAGAYHVVGLTVDVIDDAIVTRTGTIQADGIGTIAFEGLEDRDGLIEPSAPLSGTYAVGSNGAVVASLDGASLRGGIAGSGDVVILGGGTGIGDGPALYVLIK